MGVSDARATRHLPIAGAALQLVHDLVNLPQTGGADRLAVGDQPAIGVDRQPATDFRGTLRNPLLLLAIRAEPVLGHVNQLGSGVRVLQLRDLDVFGTDARHFIGGLGRVDGRAWHGFQWQRRALHFKRAVTAGPQFRGPDIDGR